MSFFDELKRRNVFRVGIAYAAVTWLLMQITETFAPALHLPEWFASAVAFLLLLGFPLALLFAWAFELTPEGVKREAQVDRDQSIAPQTGRKLDFAIIAVLAMALGWFAWDKFVDEGPGSTTGAEQDAGTPHSEVIEPGPFSAEKSVAVLPFVALSSGEDDEYFADGLTEEILNSLAQLPELLVTARTSSFHFKGQDVPVQEIAEKLGVQNIVEGSVRQAGDRLRVTAQLIRASDGFHIWSENYDSSAEDAIQVQVDIAEKIAISLNVVMDETKREAMRKAGLRNVEAFIAMQKAREKFNQAHGSSDLIENLRQANAYYEQVLEHVPGYPPALNEHSDLYGHLLGALATGHPTQNVTEGDIAEARDRMLEDVSLALENARNFIEQNEFEINLSYLSGHWGGIQARVQRYVKSSGCHKPAWAYVFALASDARSYAERIHEVTMCDPLRSFLWFDESRAWLWAGDAEKALRLARKGLEVAPAGWIPHALSWALIATGQFEEHQHAIGTYMTREIDRLAAQVSALAAQGNTADIAPLLAQLDENEFFSDVPRIQVYARIGDRAASNEIAARIDSKVQGVQVLMASTYWCVCGAPWDLEATPNFASAIEEAGLNWPPRSPIHWPLKEW